MLLQLWIGVVGPDGTTPLATLLAKTVDNLEFAYPSAASRIMSATTTAYTIAAGNAGARLVVEISISGTPTAAAGIQGHNCRMTFGSDGFGGDLPGNDTESGETFYNPWLEFANTLTFYTAPVTKLRVGTVTPLVLKVGTGAAPKAYLGSTLVWNVPAVESTSTPWITALAVVSAYRANFDGYLGTKFTVGASNLSVTALGRWVAPAPSSNNQVHSLKLGSGIYPFVEAAAVDVDMTGQPVETFVYVNLATPITLTAGAEYIIISREFIPGDWWCDWDTAPTATAAATAIGSVYGAAADYLTDYTGQGFVRAKFPLHNLKKGPHERGTTTPRIAHDRRRAADGWRAHRWRSSCSGGRTRRSRQQLKDKEKES